MRQLFCTLFLIVSVLTFTSCQGTYKDPFGGEVTWEFPDNPTQAEKKEAFEKLEEALETNLNAQAQALETGDSAMFELATSNIEDILEAKDDLNYEPPKPRSSSHGQSKAV